MYQNQTRWGKQPDTTNLGWLYYISNNIKVVFSLAFIDLSPGFVYIFLSASLIGVMHGSDDTHSVQSI